MSRSTAKKEKNTYVQTGNKHAKLGEKEGQEKNKYWNYIRFMVKGTARNKKRDDKITYLRV